MKSLIVMPTYNERENITAIVEEIVRYAPGVDILIIDDNSPDGTGEIADALRERFPHISTLHRTGKLGLGTAYIAGFRYALEHGYDLAFEMDADFSHDPRYLPDFLAAAEHTDLVIGSRYVRGGGTPNWSLLRRFISGGGNIYARFMLGLPVKDATAGYRCYRTTVLAALDLDAVRSQGYAFQVEMTYQALQHGFRVSEVPIIFVDRRIGKSKMSRKIFIEAFFYVLRARFGRNRRSSGHTANRITKPLVTASPDEQLSTTPR
ncbi:MAG TPA: polyprenol monophosphomannose synthase [Ktedonobacteraceae bacterium]|nr:polyprenol monophosphomannose synthase [Ktedonobacteraceae bacterium]